MNLSRRQRGRDIRDGDVLEPDFSAIERVNLLQGIYRGSVDSTSDDTDRCIAKFAETVAAHRRSRQEQNHASR